MFLISCYKLDNKRFAQIRAELDRRSAEGSQPQGYSDV